MCVRAAGGTGLVMAGEENGFQETVVIPLSHPLARLEGQSIEHTSRWQVLWETSWRPPHDSFRQVEDALQKDRACQGWRA